MFWLLKVLILYSVKLNTIEWCVLGLKSLRPRLHVCSFFNLRMECCIFSNYRANFEVLILTLCLNCESNKCSLCLCVRLCWGRGALWGTLDSQVTWLRPRLWLFFLLSMSNFIFFCSPQHPCLPILCYYARIQDPEWHKAVITPSQIHPWPTDINLEKQYFCAVL